MLEVFTSHPKGYLLVKYLIINIIHCIESNKTLLSYIHEIYIKYSSNENNGPITD